MYRAIRGQTNHFYHSQIAGLAYLITFAITLDRDSIQLCFSHNGNLSVNVDTELNCYRSETEKFISNPELTLHSWRPLVIEHKFLPFFKYYSKMNDFWSTHSVINLPQKQFYDFKIIISSTKGVIGVTSNYFWPPSSP